MWVSKIVEADLTIDMIDRLLFDGIEDNNENVDCIIVLGSMKAHKYRVPAAAKAYFTGRSDKIMLCGGKIRDFQDKKMTESENMYKRMLELGVPKESIIIENNSQNTSEGIERAKAEALNIIKSVNGGVIPDFQVYIS